MRPTLHNPEQRQRAREHLRGKDPLLAALVSRLGDVGPPRPSSRFATLATIILDQQLSLLAAATIRRRLWALMGGIAKPERLLSLSDEEMRGAGVSRQKTGYLRDLATRVHDGSLRLRGLHHHDDADIMEMLQRVKGLGRWSAEMFLMFALGRPDVLSTGDLGLQNAARNLYGMDQRPDAESFSALARPWRPYRTMACLYLWQSLKEDRKPSP